VDCAATSINDLAVDESVSSTGNRNRQKRAKSEPWEDFFRGRKVIQQNRGTERGIAFLQLGIKQSETSWAMSKLAVVEDFPLLQHLEDAFYAHSIDQLHSHTGCTRGSGRGAHSPTKTPRAVARCINSPQISQGKSKRLPMYPITTCCKHWRI